MHESDKHHCNSEVHNQLHGSFRRRLTNVSATSLEIPKAFLRWKRCLGAVDFQLSGPGIVAGNPQTKDMTSTAWFDISPQVNVSLSVVSNTHEIERALTFHEGKQITLNAFRGGIGGWMHTLRAKYMTQRMLLKDATKRHHHTSTFYEMEIGSHAYFFCTAHGEVKSQNTVPWNPLRYTYEHLITRAHVSKKSTVELRY